MTEGGCRDLDARPARHGGRRGRRAARPARAAARQRHRPARAARHRAAVRRRPARAAAIPAGTTGPGLLNDAAVALNRAKRTFSLHARLPGATGRVSVDATPARARRRSPARATAARRAARPRGCSSHAKIAQAVGSRRTVAATARVRQAGAQHGSFFSLTAGRRAGRPRASGPTATSQLRAPAPTWSSPTSPTKSPTPISTRGWVAWYTRDGRLALARHRRRGRGPLGHLDGDASPASRSSTPAARSTPIPFTWGPISVPAGQGIYAVGVYEIVYWVGGRPDYQWQYVNAGTTGAAAAGAANLYCVYA